MHESTTHPLKRARDRLRRTRRWLVVLALLYLAFSVAWIAISDDGDPEIPTWQAFLAWLSTPSGAAIAVGLVSSWLADQFDWFSSLQPKVARLTFLGISMSVPLVAALLGVLTAGWNPGWEPTWWPAIVTGYLAFGAGTTLHTRQLKPRQRILGA
jgi:MFS family permease